MKPVQIENMLDLAARARAMGEVFNPLFVGPPGIGKSQIVQAWAKRREMTCVDLRIAYLEAPDLIGFPSIQTIGHRQITVHATPEFLPNEGAGILLLEEPNRGMPGVMNCLMQLLTDRRIHKYELPPDWLIVSCINPEGAEYDVGIMDVALLDRFEVFHINYDKPTFIEYMQKKFWHSDVINFVETGIFNYVPPESVKNAPGAKYVSPRTLSKLNTALKATFVKEDEHIVYETILGANVGKDFYNFRNDESPVLSHDLKKNPDVAIKKLARFADVGNYRSGMIAFTIKDVINDNTIDDELLGKIVLTLPVEKATTLIHGLEKKREDNTILQRLCKQNSKIKDNFRQVLKR